MTETVNIEQRNSQAASAVVTAVGPVVVAAVGVNVAGRYLYQGWNDTSRAWKLELVWWQAAFARSSKLIGADRWHRHFYRHSRSTSHLTFNLDRNGRH